MTYDLAKCGCLPVSGSITTTLTGSRTGTETLTISGCGAASVTNEKGTTATVVLARCL